MTTMATRSRLQRTLAKPRKSLEVSVELVQDPVRTFAAVAVRSPEDTKRFRKLSMELAESKERIVVFESHQKWFLRLLGLLPATSFATSVVFLGSSLVSRGGLAVLDYTAWAEVLAYSQFWIPVGLATVATVGIRKLAADIVAEIAIAPGAKAIQIRGFDAFGNHQKDAVEIPAGALFLSREDQQELLEQYEKRQSSAGKQDVQLAVPKTNKAGSPTVELEFKQRTIYTPASFGDPKAVFYAFGFPLDKLLNWDADKKRTRERPPPNRRPVSPSS